MSVPKYDEFYRDFLNALADGSTHKIKEIRKFIAVSRNLAEDDLSLLLPSGKQTVFANRINWAGTYLSKAGLVEKPHRGQYCLSEEGKKVQQDDSILLNNDYLSQYSSFSSFFSNSGKSQQPTLQVETDTPQDIIDTAFQKINASLADDLIQEIMAQDSDFFERLVVQLLLKMGYGGPFEDAGIITTRTNDGGIDGIIKEDKLGFNQIYIQAKRWDPSTTVTRPEIHKFSGALMDKGASKGLFITTAKFSQSAIETAQRQHIVLINGDMLTRLMIEYNLGVSVSQVYEIKKIDTDYFSDND